MILEIYLKEVTNIQELERIWEAYKGLLVDQALSEMSKSSYDTLVYQSNSNLMRMVSIKKLYHEGRMYMNHEEIQAI